ncbi:MAG: phosphoenolpyruvate--protein phosphotransferase [Planctomycetota bacterium]
MKSRSIQGTSVSPGLEVGEVHVVHAGASDVPLWTVPQDEVPLEFGRLAAAMNVASEKLEERRIAIAASANPKDAEIFAVHKMILQDPGALREVEASISGERINAEAAVDRLIERFQETLRDMEGESVRSWIADVRDPWRLVLDVLMARDRAEIQQGDSKVVLAAKELTPAVMGFLGRERLLAVVTEAGGRFSHGAVLARSMGVPCVVNLPNLLARLEQGMLVGVDGDRGTVQLRPTEEEVVVLLGRRTDREARRATLAAESAEPVVTPDGHRFDVQVNVESVHDFDTFDIAHTDGVGLLRTEFLYMERSQFPSEEEQYRLYRRAIECTGGRPMTIRLLDIGGDKPLPYFKAPKEKNPALGWRGLRITLQWSDLMRVQLRALLRASPLGDLRILVPMVSSLDEVLLLRTMFNDLRCELEGQGYEVAENLPVGVMVEVPAIVPILEEVAAEVDFLSVGTNDLVQYLLAVDRDNPWVASLYEPLQPSVLRTLARIGEVAGATNTPTTVCGDVASDPLVAVLLFGLGFEGVSVSPQFLGEIKYAVRRVTRARARAIVDELLVLSTRAAVLERAPALRAQLLEG